MVCKMKLAQFSTTSLCVRSLCSLITFWVPYHYQWPLGLYPWLKIHLPRLHISTSDPPFQHLRQFDHMLVLSHPGVQPNQALYSLKSGIAVKVGNRCLHWYTHNWSTNTQRVKETSSSQTRFLDDVFIRKTELYNIQYV